MPSGSHTWQGSPRVQQEPVGSLLPPWWLQHVARKFHGEINTAVVCCFANMNGIPPYHVPQRNKQHENPLSGLVIDLTCLNQTKTESGCREVI